MATALQPVNASVAKQTKRLSVVQIVGLFTGVIGFLIPQLITLEGPGPAGPFMLGVFFMAVIFWLSEAIPVYATATLINMAEVLLVSDNGCAPKLGLNGDAYKAIPCGQLFCEMAEPVIILFSGGFFLTGTALKCTQDQNMARIVLAPFGAKPSMILLGSLLITAVFSMFMSNTTTTATFTAITLPVIATLPNRDRLHSALAMAIPVGAKCAQATGQLKVKDTAMVGAIFGFRRDLPNDFVAGGR